MDALTDLTAEALEAAPDAVVVSDASGRLVLVNGAAERVFGYTRAELLAAGVEDLVPVGMRVDHARHRERYREAPRARPMASGLALSARRKDGTVFPVEIALGPMEVNGRLLVVSVVRDVGERQRAEQALRESERRFHAIFDAAFQFIGLLSTDGRVLEVNASAIEFIGTTRSAVIGECFWDTPWWTHSAEMQTRLSQGIAKALRGEFVRFEATHPRRDGSLAPVDFSLKPVSDDDGRTIFLVAEGRDLTPIQEARADEARARAAADALREDLHRMVVHDLKNPVSGMLMLVRMLRRAKADYSERQQRHLEQLERSCEEMMRLIQNLLELGRLREGKMPVSIAPVALARIGDEVVRQYHLLAEHGGRRLRLASPHAPQVALADPTLLRRVLVNLVVNAIHHGGSREVWIEVGGDTVAGTVSIAVLDDGHGIPADEQERIFERFVTGTGGEGTGLGLPFCKLAVESMGGWIDLTSPPTGPTAFTVTLPAAAAEGAGAI